MRKHRPPGRPCQAGIESLVHGGDHSGDVPFTVFKQIQYLPLSLPPVPDHTAHKLAGIFDRRTMCGVINPVFAVVELLQACHIVAHVTVGGTDYACGPFHDMIPRKQGTTFNERVANMVRCMARRSHGFQRPAVAVDPISIRQDPVRRIIWVKGAVRPRAVIFQDQRRTANDWRAGSQFKRCGRRRVIAVGVGAQDRSDTLSSDSAQYRLDMPLAVYIRRIANALSASGRTGVDNCHIFACPDQPCLRAGVGVWRRIRGKNAADQWFVLFGFACANAVGPTHETDMAHWGKKKRGRFKKTAPTEQNEKGSLCSDQFTLLVRFVGLAFQFADLLLELFNDFLADRVGNILVLVDIAARFAQPLDGFDTGNLGLPLAAHH